MNAAPLAYYRVKADAGFWSAVWESESLERLVAVAGVSPLTEYLKAHLRPGDRVLEGGCGLGQYVIYLSRLGLRVVGVDYSAEAIGLHRRSFPESELLAADLSSLPFPDGAFDAYLSLGVIEHYRDEDADAILREARRVLTGDGRLLLSTPYLSISRRLFRPGIERRQARIARMGGDFYQYAFSERHLDAILERNGFRSVDRSYYDAGRGIRDIVRLLRPAVRRPPERVPASAATLRRRGPLARGVLDARPTLKLFAHMQIMCAVKTPTESHL